MRRLHVPQLHVGEIALDAAQAHHARTVLRLTDGASVEGFDDAGHTALGTLVLRGVHDAFLRVESVNPPLVEFEWLVAAAVPKGERADWMIEKLSELGASAFIPLAAARSVVLPEGRGKRERWMRIATESAKQSRRPGVMRIEELTPLTTAVARCTHASGATGWFFSTMDDATPLRDALRRRMNPPLTMFIGPEGGWTDAEEATMRSSGLTPVRLTRTILRVETAAIAAAAVVATMGAHSEGLIVPQCHERGA